LFFFDIVEINSSAANCHFTSYRVSNMQMAIKLADLHKQVNLRLCRGQKSLKENRQKMWHKTQGVGWGMFLMKLAAVDSSLVVVVQPHIGHGSRGHLLN
jgi:hypothetical protein